MSWRPNIDPLLNRMRKVVARRIAVLWQYAYRAQYQIGVWRLRFGSLTAYVVLLLVAFSSAYVSPDLQVCLEKYYSTERAIEGLRAVILNVGSALIGAAAIVTSLVLFAMQVNIERMPHGLFRRLSEDWKLLGAFALAFLLAIGVASLSTFVDQGRLAQVVLVAAWAVTLILASFMYAYRRALILVNPKQQLAILVKDTQRDLNAWDRRARRAKPLLDRDDVEDAAKPPAGSTHDYSRAAFFRVNDRWADGSKRSVRHAMSFARRYAEQGDYEISRAALSAVVAINSVYINAKGRTFFANSHFVENQLASDGFINDTLEQLRQCAQSGILRRDEHQIEQVLQAMAALVGVYLHVDYCNHGDSKSHAQLAAGYLAHAVQDVVPHGMADVLLEGQRLMGRSARMILANGDINDVSVLSEKISLIACSGCAKGDLRPVTMEGMAQLSNISFDLIRSRKGDIHFAVERVRRDVSFVVEMFLKVPDTPLSNSHSVFLGPYYSSTSIQSLKARLADLVNALSGTQPDSADAKAVIGNIERWADGLYQTEKKLLLEAVKIKSHFAFDMIHWIADVTEILLAVSSAPACDPHVQEALRKHASWLIATLTWIPADEDTVSFVENFQMTDVLFEAAENARIRDCHEISRQIEEMLLSWTFKSGRYQNGWGVLERGLSGLAVCAVDSGVDGIARFTTAVRARLAADPSLGQEIRDNAARGLRRRAGSLYQRGHSWSRIDIAIERTDHQQLSPLLQDIAELLSPVGARP